MKRRWIAATRKGVFFSGLCLLFFLIFLLPEAFSAEAKSEHGHLLPSLDEIFRVFSFKDFNTRVVITGTTLLGLAAGLVGTFLLLRKRALLSDTLSHATLPGIALSFIVVTQLGGDGKNLIFLMTGAVVFSLVGTAAVMFIQGHSKIKDDAALGIVLSVFFGLGIALLGIATRMGSGNAAGLTSFIYGKTASMLFFDAVLIGGVACLSIIFSTLFFKEFSLISFDQSFAETQGWPVTIIDFLMMGLVIIVTVIGLQAVGLILVVALLIIPPAAARFWTLELKKVLMVSGFIGAVSAFMGATFSALMPNLPAGAIIVMVASFFFGVSMIFGTARGLVVQVLTRMKLKAKISHENLLRAFFEIYEPHVIQHTENIKDEKGWVTLETLLELRSWNRQGLNRLLKSCVRKGYLQKADINHWALTDKGWLEASHIVRKHRLWETYLITHADIAPSQVDWGADKIEHILDEDMIQTLERLLSEQEGPKIPINPHGELKGNTI